MRRAPLGLVSRGSSRAALAAAILALCPGASDACTWCLSSAFGDRSFNWPYLGLILVPFVVAGAIGAVLAWHAGFRVPVPAGRRRRAAERAEPIEATKETT